MMGMQASDKPKDYLSILQVILQFPFRIGYFLWFSRYSFRPKMLVHVFNLAKIKASWPLTK